jgi:hypothetical protein
MRQERNPAMRIGMSLTSQYPRNGSSKEIFAQVVAQVELMAELGFDSLSFGDHHVTRDHYFQVLPTMCRMSAHARDMQLLPLFLLPFYHPILLAEQIAILDIMSGGRTTMTKLAIMRVTKTWRFADRTRRLTQPPLFRLETLEYTTIL